MGVPVQGFLKKRRDRAVASILGYLERHVRGLLADDEWETMRLKVLDSIDSYHDSVLDIVKSEDDLRNEHIVELLESIERAVGR